MERKEDKEDVPAPAVRSDKRRFTDGAKAQLALRQDAKEPQKAFSIQPKKRVSLWELSVSSPKAGSVSSPKARPAEPEKPKEPQPPSQPRRSAHFARRHTMGVLKVVGQAEMEQAKAEAAMMSPVPYEEIRVRESDLKRFGTGNLKKLRECSVAREEEKEDQEESVRLTSSFRSAFEEKCHEGADERDPWHDIENPEASRNDDTATSFLNQVWVPPEVKPQAPGVPRNSTSRKSIQNYLKGNDDQPMTRQRSLSRKASKKLSRLPSIVTSSHTPEPGSPLPSETPVQSRIQLVDSNADTPTNTCVRVLSDKQYGDPTLPTFPHVWVSLDKESGEMELYQQTAAERIEVAYCAGRQSVPLAGLGGALDGSIVHFGKQIIERSFNGSEKEARFLEVTYDMTELCVNVIVRGRAWAFADVDSDGAEEKVVKLKKIDIMRPASLSMKLEGGGGARPPQTFFMNPGSYEMSA